MHSFLLQIVCNHLTVDRFVINCDTPQRKKILDHAQTQKWVRLRMLAGLDRVCNRTDKAIQSLSLSTSTSVGRPDLPKGFLCSERLCPELLCLEALSSKLSSSELSSEDESMMTK